MSKVGYGYGSEYHLLRYLAYHRGVLKQQVDEATGGELINWLDYPFSASPQRFYHGEWQGIDFLRDNERAGNVHEAWRSYWPQTGTAPSWDAVGIMNKAERTAWVLVEAQSISAISRAIARPAQGQAADRARPGRHQAVARHRCRLVQWMSPYYGFCNRLAILHFLLTTASRRTCCSSTSRATGSRAIPRSSARNRRRVAAGARHHAREGGLAGERRARATRARALSADAQPRGVTGGCLSSLCTRRDPSRWRCAALRRVALAADTPSMTYGKQLGRRGRDVGGAGRLRAAAPCQPQPAPSGVAPAWAPSSMSPRVSPT